MQSDHANQTIANAQKRPVRTRFAPSPTGYLHIGGARTALYAWAFAKHFGGTFILRIEDTDLERSTPEAVDGILLGMNWLNLQHDEGPFFQMQRMDRYRQVVAQMLAAGQAYHCYASKDELEVMRAHQEANGEKPRYDGRWRPKAGLDLPQPPAGVKPVVRFCNPQHGLVAWDDLVKGPIEFANTELDDLIIARPDGTPTYNFCVVVDDWDMGISHVIRGDDHVNNTPRQINIFKALLGDDLSAMPLYAHIPMINAPDGQKMSKRRNAVSVMQYADDGYLPQAMLNYLGRLGWSHGDDEVFSLEQFVQWFDGTSISKSAARFDFDKLNWMNNRYMREMDPQALAALVEQRLAKIAAKANIATADGHGAANLVDVCNLLKDRANTLNELSDLAQMFYSEPTISEPDRAQHLGVDALLVCNALAKRLNDVVHWNKESIGLAIKEQLAQSGLKMPQLAVPVRLMVFGRTQTPSVDAMLAVLGKPAVVGRLTRA
jgi:glutamyl-tRNA synthetase